MEKSLAVEVLTWHTAPVVPGFECWKAKGDKWRMGRGPSAELFAQSLFWSGDTESRACVTSGKAQHSCVGSELCPVCPQRTPWIHWGYWGSLQGSETWDVEVVWWRTWMERRGREQWGMEHRGKEHNYVNLEVKVKGSMWLLFSGWLVFLMFVRAVNSPRLI